MAIVEQQVGEYTFDDFLVLVKEDQKADLLDGVIYMASPESTGDNSLGGWLYRVMAGFVEELDLGNVYVTRVAFRITEKRGPEPDVAFVAKRRARIIKQGFVDGPPDIAVEIVSPDSVQRDYVLKRNTYEEAGVREYWIINPAKQQTTFLRLRRGKFQEVKLDGSVFRSTVLRGFQIDTKWFWTSRRPSALRVVQSLLPEG